MSPAKMPSSRWCPPVPLVTLVALAAFACGPAPAPTPPAGHQPNILLISIDTLRSDRLGSYGYELPTSPYLDSLAAGGVRFADVLTPATSTRLAHRAILRGNLAIAGIEANEPLAVLLRESGYATGAIVDGGFMRARFGHGKGFDTYIDDQAQAQPGGGRPVADQKGGGFSVVLPRALNWLGEQGEQPWFLFLHTYDVHCPYEPPQQDAVLFVGDQEPTTDVSGLCGQSGLREMNLDEEGLALINALYDGGIHHADRLLGEFMAQAAESGMLENTLVAVISDHGESLGEHGWIGHNRLFREQLQVPWILSGPGVPVGHTVEGPAHLMDLVPTLMDYAGLPLPEGIAGQSLRLVAAGTETIPADRLRVTETQRARALVREPWMLVTNKMGDQVLGISRRDGQPVSGENDAPGMKPTEELLAAWNELALRMNLDMDSLDEPDIPESGEVRKELRTLGYVD
jgi:arylsulfatase A-like enzyme